MQLPLRFVWGVIPVDNGNHLDPQSTGHVELDNAFDMSQPEAQAWLLDFCQDVRRQPFYQPTIGPMLSNCFIETFKDWMKRSCTDPINGKDRSPCCESETFPYNKTVFNNCIIEATGNLYETPPMFFDPGVAGPKFSKDQFPTIKAVIVEYDSSYSYTMSYEYMHKFVEEVDGWMEKKLMTAPYSMEGGWFVTDFQFYDLQDVLSHGSVLAIATSMCIAFIVLFLTTLNVLTTVFAILTITCSVIVTIAILVLLGWKLNILESIAVTTAIGLTVDYSLHYSINYRMCPENELGNRQSATRYTLFTMSGPTFMAALTTAVAGAVMIPSKILPYIQIGIFLVAVMTVSWIYSTFYLGSLLAAFGPEQNFGQFYYSNLLCCKKPRRRNIQLPIPTPTIISDGQDGQELQNFARVTYLPPSHRILRRSCSAGFINLLATKPLVEQRKARSSFVSVIIKD